ncbi:MAG: gamma carbonic anhydrase family protein [Candidatus Thiodiazotropha sp. (ex. Lucinisca nassula)]|nr:gamma carbonic anhydrase family protein [Candidatus Thiodiazotropha sp. (ex. Lucinisca nassula)]MBW9273470.1 gamma carbonic anhydrase family protein [Candidatus Thiodiazotropha sp. (ex. Lucinisca nassula)]PUB82039.1 MAG: gamma carbonic anhydrase family protein [gamma proteobacterium symbiont of Ctena orbiculata]PUB82786.1 MAG: gamma carbonic anhydrase family protein [gamma proteobacterium symbiont of Ctena orbiculata]
MSKLRRFETNYPDIAVDAYVDEHAIVIGDVTIASQSSVWPMCVIRGDVHRISIGARSNIQDGSILHVSHDSFYQPGGSPLIIGEGVTVGHKVLLHGCEVADNCFIGMGSIILDGAVIESLTMLGAGSLVPQGKRLEGGYLWLGQPARRVRPLSDREKEIMLYNAEHYVKLAQRHRDPP